METVRFSLVGDLSGISIKYLKITLNMFALYNTTYTYSYRSLKLGVQGEDYHTVTYLNLPHLGPASDPLFLPPNRIA